ncbi:hypothetical protein OsJ_17555 [Oryza sativa Japonica Group]|uniref:BURP domain-containing protein n=1 Tax=Oryza sativa subsp. japonica TaxID=39947 RepID=B9FIW0_ORYSJ|nr:hypothetical protein OsJ_17555 [Oryza sativa Japonica Group]
MARSLAAVLLLLVAAAGASHAASPAEMYWKIALPTSPMPGAIRDLISPASSVGSASKEDTVGNVFFLEKDLFPGSKMTLHFTRATAGAALLPRGRAESVPFASERLPEILSQLSIPAVSPTADAMWSTLAECEAARLAGETTKHKHYCATSLESMVEFVASSLGTRDVPRRVHGGDQHVDADAEAGVQGGGREARGGARRRHGGMPRDAVRVRRVRVARAQGRRRWPRATGTWTGTARWRRHTRGSAWRPGAWPSATSCLRTT